MKKTICVLLFLMVSCFAATAVPEESQKVSAGDIITFGNYEQDYITANGPEAIEWIVLDVQDGKALLLSKYGLDAKPYNPKYTDVTWEDCTLRAWLNDQFLNAAFTEEEQSAILLTEVDNGAGQGYSEWNTSGGNNTQDRIFLLSFAEANKYCDVTYENLDNTGARVTPTEYAVKIGAATSDSYKTADDVPAGWWWLRSPGSKQKMAAMVYYDGGLANISVDYYNASVRPALWIDLESGIF